MAEPVLMHVTVGADPRKSPESELRELNDRNIVLPFQPFAGRRMWAQINVHKRPGLGIMRASLGGLAQGGRAAGRGDADDELLFMMNLSGTSAVTQRGRERAVADGEALLIARGEGPFTAAHVGTVELLGLRLPRRALACLVPDVESVAMTSIPRGGAALALLRGYVGSTLEHGVFAEPFEAAVVTRHVHELLALVVGGGEPRTREATRESIREARLGAMRADVLAQLDDPALSAASLAARHGITPRYVHKLFEATGGTFSEFVLEQRLAGAMRMLSDPRFDDRRISAVAFAVGFGDISYFNRTFRRRFAMAPSEARLRRRSKP